MTPRNGKVKTPRSKTQTPRTMTAFRVSEDDLAEIQDRAKKAGLSTSEYIRCAALGKLGETRSSVQERFEAVELRLDHLERFAFGGD